MPRIAELEATASSAPVTLQARCAWFEAEAAALSKMTLENAALYRVQVDTGTAESGKPLRVEKVRRAAAQAQLVYGGLLQLVQDAEKLGSLQIGGTHARGRATDRSLRPGVR